MERDIVKRFFTGTGATYDLVVNLFTYGADRYWKKKMLSKVPQCRKILDLACGTGIVTFKLFDRNSCSRIVGVDMMKEYLVQANLKKRAKKSSDVHFVCARAEQIKLNEVFDCIASSYIPKYVPADKLLLNISPYLKDQGVLVLHDFAYPTNFIFKNLWGTHMFLMKVIGTPIFPGWKIVFNELVDLVKTTKWISEYVDALPRYGFKDIEIQRLTAGSAAIISAVKAL